MTHPYDEILLNIRRIKLLYTERREWTSNTILYKRNQTDSHLLRDSLCIKFYIVRNSSIVIATLSVIVGDQVRGVQDPRVVRKVLGVMMCCILDWGSGYTVVYTGQNSLKFTFKMSAFLQVTYTSIK